MYIHKDFMLFYLKLSQNINSSMRHLYVEFIEFIDVVFVTNNICMSYMESYMGRAKVS